MGQSTKVYSPARVMGASAAARLARPSLRPSDYERVFDVLEHCDTAACLMDFKERMLEALGCVFGFRHTSFFAGATFQTTFGDNRPLVEGCTGRMLPEYQDRWFRYDVFSTPIALKMLMSTHVASLSELTALPDSAKAYVRHFLVGTWGMESATALKLELPGGHTALIGIFDQRPDALGRPELSALRLLGRQLSAIARGLPSTQPAATVLTALSDRQRQVVRLVADGLSNAQVAEALSLTEDTVKKYVSRILASTGCHSRTELAILARPDLHLRWPDARDAHRNDDSRARP